MGEATDQTQTWTHPDGRKIRGSMIQTMVDDDKLMIFRERVIIFSQAGVVPPDAIDDLIEQAKALDMDKVREEVSGGEASAS